MRKKSLVSDQITAGKSSAAFINLKNPIANYVVNHTEGIVCGTTCNISGESEIIKFQDAFEIFKNEVDMFIRDDSMIKHKRHSTIVSFVKDPPGVIRKGACEISKIKKIVAEMQLDEEML